MDIKKEFKRLTRAYAKSVFALLEKDEKEDEDEEEEVVEVAPEPKKAKTNDDNWTCSGQVWNDPIIPCAGATDKSKIKNGIKHNGKRVVVCRECFLARERIKNQEKRDKKKAQLQKAIQ